MVSSPAKAPGVPTALLERCTRVGFGAGETVFRSGTPTHSVYYVVSGAVRLVRFGRAGEEVLLHDARAGEFFAEASLDSPRYHCDAVAGESSELLQCPSVALKQLLDTDREFARQWMSLLARQLRTVRTRVERLSLKSASERVRHLLVSEGRGPRCELKVQGTLKDLARTLGLTHEALYRTLATMEREGAIEREGMVLRLAR
jgi:CRP-like cAMP-binding protein